jgi:hypothetical protein
MSEEIRAVRRERIRELREERAGLPTLADLPVLPPPAPEPVKESLLLIERAPAHRSRPFEFDRTREREVIFEETRARRR